MLMGGIQSTSSPLVTAVTVSTLGEVFVHSDKSETYLGSLSARDLQRKLGRTPTSKDFDEEFDRLLRIMLENDKASIAFVRKVWRFQKLNDARFRINGRHGGIFLSTEFKEVIEKIDFWRRCYALAGELGAEVEIMDESPIVEHTIKNHGKENEEHVYGPDHGKMARQVAFNWNVTEVKSVNDLKKLIERYSEATEPIWHEAGVGVL